MVWLHKDQEKIIAIKILQKELEILVIFSNFYIKGSESYMAPELKIVDKDGLAEYDERVDVYALG